MNKLKQQYYNLFNSKTDAIGLAVFRIAFALVLLMETLQLYKFRHIIYDKDPFIAVGELNVVYLFYFWFIIIGFLILGLFTRFTTILNYIFSVIIFSSAVKFEYHVFYAYVGVNFLMMFLPVSRVFSVDSLVQKIKYSGIGKPYAIDRKVLKINYLVPVFAAIGLVYIDSIFHKLSSKMWMDGLGVWLPSSLPMVIWNDTSFILNNEFLVKFLGYIVLVFEALFIFLFWFRKFRVAIVLLGLFFHIGILIAYPIPWFALAVVAVYLLMVPTSFWLFISNKIKLKKALYNFYYDAECPLCAKVIVAIRHFDIFHAVNCLTVQGNYQSEETLKPIDETMLLINIHGVTSNHKLFVGYWAYVQLFKSMIYTYPVGLLLSLPGISYLGRKVYAYIAGDRLTIRCTEENCTLPVYNTPISESEDILVRGWNKLNITRVFWKLLLVFFIFAQAMFIWFSPYIQEIIPAKAHLNKVVNIPFGMSNGFLTKYLGITFHPVFMFNGHFKEYVHIFKVEYTSGNKKGLVPMLDDNGMVKNSYATGCFWVNYTFRVDNREFELDNFTTGIVPYLRYFENESGLQNNTYTFYVKEINPQEKWQKDFLHEQMRKPWQVVGSATSKDSLSFRWNDKMMEIVEGEKK